MAFGSSIGTALGSITGGLSPIPGGSLAGGALGGLLGGLFEGSGNQPSSAGQQQSSGLNLSTQKLGKFTPDQLSALSQLLSTGLAGAGQGLDFAPIRQQATTQFQQQTVPGLAERFTRLGSRGSSAFAQQLGQAGAGLQQGLAGQEAQFGLQKQGALANLLKMGLAPQFDTIAQQQSPSFGSQAAPGIGASLPQLLMLLLQNYQQGSGATNTSGVV